jgi:hypothetical protein
MPEPEPDGVRRGRTKRRRFARLIRALRPVVVVLQGVYCAVRVVRELMD